jgi:hypothetical protein
MYSNKKLPSKPHFFDALATSNHDGKQAHSFIKKHMPYLSMQWIGSLNEKNEELTVAQVRIRAFFNSGT